MDNRVIILLVAIIGGLFSFLVEVGIEKEFRATMLRRISIFIIGSIISGLGTLTFFLANDFTKLHKEIKNIDEYLVTTNAYSNAVRAVDNLNAPIAKFFFGERLIEIEKDLNDISNQDIVIARSEILNNWEKLIKKAHKSVWATNLVSQDDWKFVSRDKAGLKVQEEAIKRGVEITRINFYDESVCGHKEGLASLKRLHESVNIKVYELPVAWIDNNETYNKTKQRLGTADIVIVDDAILLLTVVNPKTYKMEWATLTCNGEKILTAKNFFRKLLNDLEYERRRERG
jgi:hypothetical protein